MIYEHDYYRSSRDGTQCRVYALHCEIEFKLSASLS